MSAQSTHPSRDELSAYSLGQLPQDQAALIDSHISECEPCCDTIVALSSEDTFIGLLQQARHLPADQEDLPANQPRDLPAVPAPLAEHPRYEILGLIGKGGMGDVYKAKHRKMERTVALKVINLELFRKPEAVNRFHREVKTAAQLSHPNIVTSHDADQAGDFHFMVMEYIDGVDLSMKVKNQVALPIAEACDYIRQAAIGLQHAHERGMVHRDIKPHNLMVTADGTVKILDFGLASLAPEVLLDDESVIGGGDLTAAGAIIGTPDFISPEQAEDAHQADIRGDIYSLGATLYFLLSGRPPFADCSVMHKLKSHAQEEPEPLASLRSDVPSELTAVISKMIAKDPNDRFQTPVEVAEALSPFAGAALAPSTSVRRVVGDTPRTGSNKAWPPRLSLLSVGGFGLAFALIAAVVFFVQSGKTTLRFEINDPNIKVTFAGETIGFDTPDNKTFRIEPSTEHKFAVFQNGVEVETDSLMFRRGDKVVLRIDVVEGQIEIASNVPGVQRAEKQPPKLVGKHSTPDDISNQKSDESALLKQMSQLFDSWKGLPEDSKDAEEFAQKINAIYDKLKKQQQPNTEASRQTSTRLAVLAWFHLSNPIPKSMARKLVDLTKPDAAVRVSDRLAAAGRPTEPVGWDVQAAHALALARAGKTEESLKENRALIKKIEVNLQKGRLPDLQLKFLGKLRSQKSLLQQSLLQKALILGIAGKTAESVDAATAAGRVEVDKPTKEDQPAIQAMLGILAKTAGTSVDEPHTPTQSKVSAEQKTTEFLEEAARRGDLEAVVAALKAGVAPNLPSNPLTDLFRAKQLTALHWAVTQRIAEGKTIEPSPEIAKRLIEAGADVNAADYLGQTPLEWAAPHGPPEIVKMLIKAGANVNAESRYGTVLEATRDVEIARLLIEAGANVNAGTTMTPLAKAAKSNNVEMVQLLIEKGAKVNDTKNPPIHWAGKPDVVKALLKAGADVNQRNGKGETVLHLPGMSFGPDAETVKLLIEAGANVNARSQTDATPLHAAIEQNKAEIAQLLIAAGAELDAKDKKGNTPLSLAHRGIAWARITSNVEIKSYEALEKLLVDAGAKDDGRTPLQQAVAAGDLDQVKKLIAAQVDVNETGPQKITAMHLASKKGNKAILAALLKAGAKPDQADSQGLRPLHLAANAEMARMLIAANAKINTGMPSPLYIATVAGRADVVRELVKHKANVKDSDCAGILNWTVFAGQAEVIKVLFEERDAKVLLQTGNVYSPLHVAASGTLGDVGSPKTVTPQRRLDIAKFLIEKGADVNARWGTQINPQSGAAHMINTTPLMFASQKGEPEMVKFLLEKGGQVNATNAIGQTALHFAAQSGHDQVVELLLKAKADINALTKEAKTPLDLTQNAAVKIHLLKNGGKTAAEALKDSQR